jgi:hypothetical protein
MKTLSGKNLVVADGQPVYKWHYNYKGVQLTYFGPGVGLRREKQIIDFIQLNQLGPVYVIKDNLIEFNKKGINIDSINHNHVGMIEQIVCANAYTFIGTPLSTYTSYITRLRGYMNITSRGKGFYDRTYYFMEKHMYQLHAKPHLTLPFWPREFVDSFDVLDPIYD